MAEEVKTDQTQEEVEQGQRPAESAEEQTREEGDAIKEEAVETEETRDLASLLERQEQINEELTNRLARLQADFDNYRRRTRKDIEELNRFGGERLILSLLPVLDNFERALAAADDKPELAQFATGMEMIYRQLKETLEKEGVAVIPTANEFFDPQKHHAVAQVETDEYEENMIVDELQKGYVLHDKVIRASVVRVAKN